MLGEVEATPMAKFEMISMKVLVENEGLRHYLAGAPAVTDAKKGGTFVGNRDIAPDSLRPFGIVLPKGGMILPQHKPEEVQGALKEALEEVRREAAARDEERLRPAREKLQRKHKEEKARLAAAIKRRADRFRQWCETLGGVEFYDSSSYPSIFSPHTDPENGLSFHEEKVNIRIKDWNSRKLGERKFVLAEAEYQQPPRTRYSAAMKEIRAAKRMAERMLPVVREFGGHPDTVRVWKGGYGYVDEAKFFSRVAGLPAALERLKTLQDHFPKAVEVETRMFYATIRSLGRKYSLLLAPWDEDGFVALENEMQERQNMLQKAHEWHSSLAEAVREKRVLKTVRALENLPVFSVAFEDGGEIFAYCGSPSGVEGLPSFSSKDAVWDALFAAGLTTQLQRDLEGALVKGGRLGYVEAVRKLVDTGVPTPDDRLDTWDWVVVESAQICVGEVRVNLSRGFAPPDGYRTVDWLAARLGFSSREELVEAAKKAAESAAAEEAAHTEWLQKRFPEALKEAEEYIGLGPLVLKEDRGQWWLDVSEDYTEYFGERPKQLRKVTKVEVSSETEAMHALLGILSDAECVYNDLRELARRVSYVHQDKGPYSRGTFHAFGLSSGRIVAIAHPLDGSGAVKTLTEAYASSRHNK